MCPISRATTSIAITQTALSAELVNESFQKSLIATTLLRNINHSEIATVVKPAKAPKHIDSVTIFTPVVFAALSPLSVSVNPHDLGQIVETNHHSDKETYDYQCRVCIPIISGKVTYQETPQHATTERPACIGRPATRAVPGPLTTMIFQCSRLPRLPNKPCSLPTGHKCNKTR